MACITCGKSFSGSEIDLINAYKKMYDLYGTERWVYRFSDKERFQVTKNFKEVFKKLKPKLSKGAEYFHISEFRNK
jgi:hypothetical protein